MPDDHGLRVKVEIDWNDDGYQHRLADVSGSVAAWSLAWGSNVQAHDRPPSLAEAGGSLELTDRDGDYITNFRSALHHVVSARRRCRFSIVGWRAPAPSVWLWNGWCTLLPGAWSARDRLVRFRLETFYIDELDGTFRLLPGAVAEGSAAGPALTSMLRAAGQPLGSAVAADDSLTQRSGEISHDGTVWAALAAFAEWTGGILTSESRSASATTFAVHDGLRSRSLPSVTLAPSSHIVTKLVSDAGDGRVFNRIRGSAQIVSDEPIGAWAQLPNLDFPSTGTPSWSTSPLSRNGPTLAITAPPDVTRVYWASVDAGATGWSGAPRSFAGPRLAVGYSWFQGGRTLVGTGLFRYVEPQLQVLILEHAGDAPGIALRIGIQSAGSFERHTFPLGREDDFRGPNRGFRSQSSPPPETVFNFKRGASGAEVLISVPAKPWLDPTPGTRLGGAYGLTRSEFVEGQRYYDAQRAEYRTDDGNWQNIEPYFGGMTSALSTTPTVIGRQERRSPQVPYDAIHTHSQTLYGAREWLAPHWFHPDHVDDAKLTLSRVVAPRRVFRIELPFNQPDYAATEALFRLRIGDTLGVADALLPGGGNLTHDQFVIGERWSGGLGKPLMRTLITHETVLSAGAGGDPTAGINQTCHWVWDAVLDDWVLGPMPCVLA